MSESQSIRVWTVSNALSLVRMFLPFPVISFAGDVGTYRTLILAICALIYLTDVGDGFFARRFNQESDLGRIIDPLADKICAAVFAIVFVYYGLLPLWYVIIILVRDALIFSGGMYLKKITGILVQSNNLGRAAVLTIGLSVILALFKNEIGDTVFTGVLILSAAVQFISFLVYGRRFKQLIKSN